MLILRLANKSVKTYEDILTALKGKEGKDVDFIVMREVAKERGNFNYLVRRVEIDRVVVVDELGARRAN